MRPPLPPPPPPTQEDYDHVSLEEHYKGDGSMLSPKAKLLLRESKKELLRYAPTPKQKNNEGERVREREREKGTPQWTITESPVNNRSARSSWRTLGVSIKKGFSPRLSLLCSKEKSNNNNISFKEKPEWKQSDTHQLPMVVTDMSAGSCGAGM